MSAALTSQGDIDSAVKMVFWEKKIQGCLIEGKLKIFLNVSGKKWGFAFSSEKHLAHQV